jgi:hypothetical protein
LKRLFALGAVAALSLVPIGGISALGYARGIAGDLSVTSVLLLVSAVVAPKLLGRQELRSLAAFVIGGALLLYPMALGLSAFDPYALGFPGRARGLLLVLFLVVFFAWWRGRILLLLAILLGIGAYRLGLLESSNLWDYFLDPWLAVAAAGFTIFGRFSKSR